MDPLTNPTGAARVVDWLAGALRPVSRRSVFVSTAVAGSALATNPRSYALRPVSAYSTICGPGNKASNGWTVFCATINKGYNTCPPGSFAAGWWKAAGSSWCGGGYRYIVDCNASCSKCSTGCSDGICDNRCWSCSCGTGSTATCDQRRVCCNAFRYGQCNTHIKCSGGVHCRVVSCSPPYEWDRCTTTSLRDDRTSEHSTSLLPQWGPISARYHAMGDQRSFLKSSIGPIKSVGDGRGQVLTFTGGAIFDSTSTKPVALRSSDVTVLNRHGGVRGRLGYPTAQGITSTRSGYYVSFQKGAIARPRGGASVGVHGASFQRWTEIKRQAGRLGYPVAEQQSVTGGWIQRFETGAIAARTGQPPIEVYAEAYESWRRLGLTGGWLGFPLAGRTGTTTRWVQTFTKGALAQRSAEASPISVTTSLYDSWVETGAQRGPLRMPVKSAVTTTRGKKQDFEGGELWRIGTGPGYAVTGRVLTAWKAARGHVGRYGYPLSHTTDLPDGTQTARFEGGTITA